MRCKFMLVGVVGAVVLAVVGGLAYHFLESEFERHAATHARQLLKQFLDNKTCLNLTSVKTLTDILQLADIGAIRVGVSADSSVENLTNWDLQSTIFLAFEVIGAIGYGNATPRTVGGRVFCVFYALLGIPLFIAAAVGISQQLLGLAESIRAAIYRRLLRRACPHKSLASSYITDAVILLLLGLVLFVFIPAAIFTALESWTYPEALYCCFITILSIGFGDFVPGSQSPARYQTWYRLGVGFWIILALLWFGGGIFVATKLALNYYDKIVEPFELPDDKNTKQNEIRVDKHWKKQFDKQFNKTNQPQDGLAPSSSSADQLARPVSRLQVSELDVVPVFSSAALTRFNPAPFAGGHVTLPAAGAIPGGGIFVTDNISRVAVGGGAS